MATGGDDRTVIIWETVSGKSRKTLKGHDLTVTSVAFSPDGDLLAVGSGNASVVVLVTDYRFGLRPLRQHRQFITHSAGPVLATIFICL